VDTQAVFTAYCSSDSPLLTSLIESQAMFYVVRKMPILLAHPDSKSSTQCIYLSLLFTLVGLVILIIAPVIDDRSIFVISFFVIISYTSLIIPRSRNILYALRYFMLAIIPLAASFAWGFFPGLLLAPFGSQYQTFNATAALVSSGILALTGSSIGWFLPFAKFRHFSTDYVHLATDPRALRILNKIALASSLFFSLLTLYIMGGIINESSVYTQSFNSLGFRFDASNAFLFLSTGLYLATSSALSFNILRSFLVAAMPYFLPILAGNRADSLIQLILLLTVAFVIFLRKDVSSLLNFWYLLFAFPSLLFIAMTIASWRATGFISFEYLSSLSSLFLSERDSGLLINLDTANQIAAHFYIVFAKLNLLNQDLLYGSSYFDYIFRTLPGFLGFNRPQDLSSLMFIYPGEIMSQGGSFELAEAFWNFSYVGAFLIPLLISLIFSSLLLGALTRPSSTVFYQSVFIAFGLFAPRAIWYQNFAYYRLLTIAVFLYILIIFCSGRSGANRTSLRL
jgi:hypothetical protein